MRSSVTVYLGLGSNKGNRISNLKEAIDNLSGSRGLEVLKVSSFYKTFPVGPRQKDFVNAVLKARCSISPAGLLKLVKNIEKRMGRIRNRIKWGPRKIDIDILFFGKRKINAEKLMIPHPEIANRLFVLEPLSELAPGFRHPVINSTVAELKEWLLLTSEGQKVKRLSDGK